MRELRWTPPGTQGMKSTRRRRVCEINTCRSRRSDLAGFRVRHHTRNTAAGCEINIECRSEAVTNRPLSSSTQDIIVTMLHYQPPKIHMKLPIPDPNRPNSPPSWTSIQQVQKHGREEEARTDEKKTHSLFFAIFVFGTAGMAWQEPLAVAA